MQDTQFLFFMIALTFDTLRRYRGKDGYFSSNLVGVL